MTKEFVFLKKESKKEKIETSKCDFIVFYRIELVECALSQHDTFA